MPNEIRVPRLGWSMEVGTFLGWLKQDGDQVAEGEALYELEGEKASQEIESIDEGVLRIPPDAPAAGTELPVGALLGYLLGPDEPLPWESIGDTSQATKTTDASEAPPSSPSVRQRARELGVALDNVRGSGKRGRITRADVEQCARQANGAAGSDHVASRSTSLDSGHGGNGARVVATPRARRVADELNVDLTHLDGSGRNGRIRECDVRLATNQPDPAPQRVPVAESSQTATGASTPTTKLRRVIARRMVASHQTTAPVTLTTLADAANLQSTRAQFRSASPPAVVPSLNDLIIKLVAAVIPRHLLIAGQWRDDRIVLPALEEINIGLSVDTDAGLMVPVVHNALHQSVVQIAQTTSEQIKQARAGKLSQSQLEGGVFTVTNLGPLGIDAFTPVINVPESAILGIGAIRRQAIVQDDDQIVIGSRMTLSLTFDHRIIDGAPAAAFLADVRQAIEHPVPHLCH